MYLSRHRCPAPYQSMSAFPLRFPTAILARRGDNVEHTLVLRIKQMIHCPGSIPHLQTSASLGSAESSDCICALAMSYGIS